MSVDPDLMRGHADAVAADVVPPPVGYIRRRAIRRRALLTGSAAVLVAVLATTGVLVGSAALGDAHDRLVVTPVGTATPSASPSASPWAQSCPKVRPQRPGIAAAVDYVDFLHAFGHDYVAGLGPRVTVRPDQLGGEIFRVRCSLSRLNDETGATPPRARDGDAAFLAPGTPVYSVDGWSPKCRLAARLTGRLQVYLAQRNGGAVSAPLKCAVSR